ncbi:hemicentin-1-like, partial [Mercenaria mercenaria]|uniref:hemicentin-1-like n=1 Tax=Mercenaria mercenaria TaxID=6596 RepID=UPI00234ED18D
RTLCQIHRDPEQLKGFQLITHKRWRDSPVTPSIPTGSFPWREGQQGRTLNCSTSDYGNPEADVSWKSSIGTPALRILRLPKLTQYYHGISVSCQLSNKYTQKMNKTILSEVINLDIMYKPDVFIHIGVVERYSIVRNESESLTAVCSAKGNPVPTVTWQDRTPGNPRLEFTDIDRNDHGIYICSAKASSSHYPEYDFSNETTLDVTVNYAPNVTINLSNGEPEENSSLLISCSAVGRPVNYVYTSMKQTWEGIQIQNIHRPVHGNINIMNLQLQDSGIYTCAVNNGIRDRNQQLDQIGTKSVLVKVSPKVLHEGTYTFAGAVGTSVNITIPFYSYPKIKHVGFRLENGSEITNSSKYEVSYRKHNVTYKFYNEPVDLEGYIAVLHIKDEEVSDFRNYTLVLQNDIGPPKEWILEHVSESKPSAPVSFIYTGIVDDVPTFSLVGGFNGGRIQTFIVETAVVGTENWMEQIRFNETDKAFLTDESLTFNFNITGLGPNTYNIRVLTENYMGRIEEGKALTLEFTIISN